MYVLTLSLPSDLCATTFLCFYNKIKFYTHTLHTCVRQVMYNNNIIIIISNNLHVYMYSEQITSSSSVLFNMSPLISSLAKLYYYNDKK